MTEQSPNALPRRPAKLFTICDGTCTVQGAYCCSSSRDDDSGRTDGSAMVDGSVVPCARVSRKCFATAPTRSASKIRMITRCSLFVSAKMCCGIFIRLRKQSDRPVLLRQNLFAAVGMNRTSRRRDRLAWGHNNYALVKDRPQAHRPGG